MLGYKLRTAHVMYHSAEARGRFESGIVYFSSPSFSFVAAVMCKWEKWCKRLVSSRSEYLHSAPLRSRGGGATSLAVGKLYHGGVCAHLYNIT